MGSLPHIVEDCLGIVRVYSDGSISRLTDINLPMKVQDDGSAVWKDCLFDKEHNLHLRLYKPRSPTDVAQLPQLLPPPLLRSASSPPAAVDDAMSSVEWLRDQTLLSNSGGDGWFANGGVDFARVFIVGDSSGGNLAHHVAVQLRRGSPELAPIRVRGYVLMAPFFGGTVRTKSEEEGPELLLNSEILDRQPKVERFELQDKCYPIKKGPRPPAAVDDAMSSVEWLRDQTLLSNSGGDGWFANGGVDFARVFIVGDSSGGNLAHHVAVQLRRGSPELAPIRVRGYVLMAPFFGGTVRTKSEEEGPELLLNSEILDR
ncbi:putative carboxylesterase 15 [Dorcoceras hygrometricum]|uniref:Putative carboxylesterase 15 n=1 Tax=Dorcoceras hygrometricum TaxID=472368 RepID=A0A2Z7CWA6_9LAMI|nr:putative carboxylesterase 15 [Dorcoceras hygrometricum]